jgi:hypothetical protein
VRPGHNSSGSLQESFEADPQVQAMFEPIQQGKLIDKDGSQGEPLRVDQALGRHLAVAIEDAFELLKVLNG